MAGQSRSRHEGEGSIFDSLAETVAFIAAALGRLRIARKDVDAVLSGGIFRRDDEAFSRRIREAIAGVAPRAQMRIVLSLPSWAPLSAASTTSTASPTRASGRARRSLTSG